MSDSDKTNELDNYGVWVKKPPRTVSSEETSSDNFDIASDLPDFSSLDVIENTPFDTGDTSLSADELSAIASTTEITQEETPDTGSSDTEEISLDEFIEGGIFEGDDGGSAASEASEKAAESESSSVDSFDSDTIDSFDTETVSSSTDVVSNSVSISDDSPLDIDLSFDDSPVGETSGFTSSSTSSFDSTDSVSSSSEGTESIDLSDFGFDINAPEGGESTEPATETQSESSDSENVDLSEFGFDIDAPEGGNSEEAPATEESTPSDSSETESVDLSDFGFDINAPEGGAQEADSEPEVAETSSDSGSDGSMEEISLDSFGFDIDAEEGQAESSDSEETSSSAAETESLSDSGAFETGEIDDISLDGSSESSGEVIDLDSLSLDPSSDETPSLELPETDGIEMSVSADDDMELPDNSSSGSEPDQNFTAEDDDFDLDSIMDSIEDENGDKVSLNSPDDLVKDVENVSTDISTEGIHEEPIQDLNFSETSSQEIPDSFDEETASLFGDSEEADDTIVEDNIVEQDEPVFEETSVDISEIESFTAEELNLGQQESSPEESETSNPFTLPSDDAFELPETPAENNNFADFSDNSEAANDIIEDAAESGEDLGFSSESEISEEINNESPAVTEEIQDNSEISNITEGKDEEIASATNSILSQIVSELASLKNEISGLKNEFEEIKSKEIPAETEGSGFFSGDEEDDTIALSVDELDNILNTVEIVDEQDAFEGETAEESAVDFAGNELEEPVTDSNVEITSEEDETESPDEEILVPKVDDILVESGSSDLMEESEEKTEEEDLSIGDFSFESDETEEYQPEAILPDETSESLISSSSLDEPFEFGSDTIAEESEENSDDIAPQDETEVPEEDSIAISNDELENLLAPDPSINDSLTDSNLNYLTADKEIGSEAKSEESTSSSIPGNLQKEIKSVLSYMDQLLENLPEEKIAEFAQSEQFETYKKLFKELGLDN